MSGQRHRGVLAVVAILLVTISWSGCGKKDQPTDLLDQPTGGTPTGTPGQTGDDWPPPPPAVPGGTTGEAVGDEGEPAAALPPNLADVYFEFDKYDLTAEARQTLAQNARAMEGSRSLAVMIEGHCDERGTIEYNLARGEKRAGAVKDYLVRYGIPSTRLGTVSYGEERPVDTAHTEEAWARNRRAHLRAR